VPLLLIDLDNTLLDRTGAYQVWAEQFLATVGAPADEIEWMLKLDDDGRTPRREVAEEIKHRYGLSVPDEDLVEAARAGIVINMRLDPLVACALHIAGNAGWVPVVVSNGAAHQQEAKIRMSGLDRYLADWVISEEVGVSKPNPEIFEIAAHRARQPLRGGWMIGDSPEADIAGGAQVGLRTAWLRRGRRWTDSRFSPTVAVNSPIEALYAVLDGGY
jgi:putative hydrolase of the HAD superfamily